MQQDLEELLALEGLVPLKQLIPEKSDATRKRWIKYGIRGVRLEATLNGGLWVSSKKALARFRARLRGQTVQTPVEDASEMVKRAEAARKKRMELAR